MANNQVFKLYDFSGGLNEIGENIHLKKGETPYCKNVVFDELGAMVKRQGYQSVLDTSLAAGEQIDGLYIYHESNGERHMIAVAAGTLYEIDEDNKTSIVLEYAGGTLVNDLTDTDYVGFTTWGNRCYITNGKDPVMEYDGTEVVKWDSAKPKGKYITSHKNMIFWAGNDNSPSEVFFSEIAPPAGSPGNYGSVGVQTDDGDRIMNIIKQQDNLVTFKSDSIHVLYGSSESNFALREVQPTIGTVAPKSVVNFQNTLFFLYRDGIYTFDGTNTQIISTKITPTINKFNNPKKCAGAIEGQKYYLAYSDDIVGSPNEKVLIFSLIHNSWSRFENYPAAMFNNFDGSQDGARNMEELYFGSSKTGQIYIANQGYADDGDNIQVEYRTKHFNLDAVEIIKTFRHIMVDNLTVGSFKLIYDVDKGFNTGSFRIEGLEANPESLWDANNWDELIWAGDSKPHLFGSPLRPGTYGRNIRFVINEDSQNVLKLYGINLNFRPRRKRMNR